MLLSEYFEQYRQLTNKKEEEHPCIKIFILRSFSCEIISKLLTVDLNRQGFRCEFMIGGFNQFSQEILIDDSDLYRFHPDIVLLCINIEDICSQIFEKNQNLEKGMENDILNDLQGFFDLISHLREKTHAYLIVNNFVKPYYLSESVFDDNQEFGTRNAIRYINHSLTQYLCTLENCCLLDFEGIVSNVGHKNSFDLKQNFLSRNPYSPTVYCEFSEKCARIVALAYGKRKKCIVLDLDNTLWKGIVGEDGFDGIVIDDCYRQFQKQLLYWQKSGVILAINSKNNYEDVIDILENHPDMVLRKKDFSFLCVNWESKEKNLATISQVLNIGLDSMIFIDDSEFECTLIQETFPNVEVIRLDGDKLKYFDTAKSISSLDFIKLTEEDRNRTALYKSQEKREALRKKTGSIRSYLESLNIVVTVKKAEEYEYARIAQLTQRTNQFNLTSRRYSQNELQIFIDNGNKVFPLYVSDRFGDSGLSGLIMLSIDKQSAAWEIENFLLSCRVLSREIEKAAWAAITQIALDEGIKLIFGEFIPTVKNTPTKGLLQTLGFLKNNIHIWQYELREAYSPPEFITLIRDV